MKLKKLLIVLFALFCGSIYGQPGQDCPCLDPMDPDYLTCLATYSVECDESIPVDTNVSVVCIVGVLYAAYLYWPKSNKTKTLI